MNKLETHRDRLTSQVETLKTFRTKTSKKIGPKFLPIADKKSGQYY